MKNLLLIPILLATSTLGMSALLLSMPALASAEGMDRKPPQSRRLLAEGEHQYRMRCARCHGERGDGNGPVADFLDPRPRDFTLGMFKFRTTATGALPTDGDLFRTITRGIPGTAMPSWEGLPEGLRWALVYYIKTFAEDFADPELAAEKSLITLPPKVAATADSIARGKALYERNKCWECHGREARGDGRSNLKNDWGHPTRVPNLRYGWNIKGGLTPEDIVYRFTTGLNGTAMPSYEESITGEDRWHLANYIVSLARTGFDKQMIFKAEQTAAALPLDADAALWRTAEPTPIFLQGQTLITPAWINHAVALLEVRALYNRDQIGFLIEWDDPVRDAAHHEAREVRRFQDQYVKALGEIPREPGVFRDALALRFPVDAQMGKTMPPYFGSPDRPLNQWAWKSDLAARAQSAVEESNQLGLGSAVQVQPETADQVRSRAEWRDGRWRLVLIRSLTTADADDVQFRPGGSIPIAFNVWDGSNGEHGLIMALSSWHLLHLNEPGSDLFDRMERMLWFFDVSGKYAPP